MPFSGIPSNHGALAFPPGKQKSIAEQMTEALMDTAPPRRALSYSALSSIPDGKTTSSEVLDWMNVTHADAYGWDGTQHIDTPTDAASKAEDTSVKDTTAEDTSVKYTPIKDLDDNYYPTTSTEQRFADHDLADLLPTENKDEWDEWANVGDDWEMIGDDDFGNDEDLKNDLAKYKYTKKDAMPARKGWMASLFKGKKKSE